MRTATIYNFLLEANLMASAAILLMILIRKLLRRPLGNRLIYALWLLIAIRLLCPLALANPAINEIRPFYLIDQGIRPIAGQLKIRFEDAVDSFRRLVRSNEASILYTGASDISDGIYYGTFSKLLMRVYLLGAGAVALFFAFINVRFRRKMRANRIEEISGKLREQYLEVCKARRVKPIPVWFADPLPSACLVGVFRPYIALPLTAAPQEAVHVLTHEICHYQGKDHWFSVLRLLCCAIHWFNPLVWLAAYMSRTDGELSCDSRVVRPLSKEDRLNYTNTLVLAASKRYVPGVGVLATGMTMTGKKLQNRVRNILNYERAVKWLMITVAALACTAFAAAFFTAESYVFPEMPVFYSSSAAAAKPLESNEDALQFAKTFFAGDAFALDLTNYAWEVNDTDTAYEVQAYPDADEMGMPVTLTVLKTGIVTDFYVPSDFDRAAPMSNMYAGDSAKQEEVAAYIASFWAANQPSTADSMEAMEFEGEYAIAGMRFVSFYGVNAASDSAYLTTVQVLPEVKMISFHTDSAMYRSLLGTGAATGNAVSDAAVPVVGINDFKATDSAVENSLFTVPTDDAIDVNAALNLGIRAIAAAYGESDMSRFYILYGFVSAESSPDDSFLTPYWQFSLRNTSDPADCYDVIVHATDGEILYLAGPGEGNG
jgi:beta-lactamase regulating signal transducer with metallopeptidase domain